MKPTRTLSVHAILACLLAAPLAAQTRADHAARIAELERLIPALMDSADIPGLTIASVADGELRWARGFGVRSTDTWAAVDANTAFEAASLSKPVVAYAVLKLVDQGVLDLDRPLHEYWPYEDIAHDERYKQITARMALSHTPGFPNWRPHGGELTINFDPGSRFSYSGEGFVFLQRVVEQLAGEPLHAFVKRTVLEPLEMTNSSYVWEERFAENVAVGHRTDGTPRDKAKPESANAAWSLLTTAPDYARFLAAVLNGEGLSAEIAAEMLTPQSEVDPGVNWGLGIGLQESDAGLALWHWGHNDGYRAYTIAHPASRTAFVWFINSDNGMLILEPLLAATVGGEHPAAAWLDYERYDSPARRVRLALGRTVRDDGIDAGLQRYRELKSTYPSEAFEENMLNSLGYSLLGDGLLPEAIAVFKLNVEMFPEAWNPYDSLGEAYMEAGDLDRAIEYYEKSVELNPENTNGIRMLERLRAELANRTGGF